MSKKSSSSTAASSKTINLQDIEGIAVAGNETGGGSVQVNITDSGAFELVRDVAGDQSQLSAGALNLAGDIIEGAASLTLDILDRQAAQNAATVKAVTDTASTASAPDGALVEKVTQVLMVLGGGLALAMAMKAKG